MPAFFMISGYLHKPLDHWSQLLPWIGKRAKQLLIPYVSFFIVITALRYAVDEAGGNFTLSLLRDDVQSFLLGGRHLAGWYGPFWFITCLFLTQVVFTLILFIRRRWMAVCVLAACFALAHLEGIYVQQTSLRIPWNGDIALMAVIYYAIGYYGKNIINRLNPMTTVTSGLFTIGFISLCEYGWLSFHLDMKYAIYNWRWDLLIPVTMTVLLFGVSRMVSARPIVRILSAIGSASLPIMYLHIPVNLWLQAYRSYGFLLFSIVGVLIPFIVTWGVFHRFRCTRRFFLGLSPQKK